MFKPYFWVVLCVLLLNLFAFQNCGKMATSQSESASSMLKIDVSGAMVEKELIVRMKDDASNSQLASWAASSGLANMNADNQTAMSNWDSMRMSHWNWQGPSTVEEVMQKLSQASFADKIEYMEPNYVLNTIQPLSDTTTGSQQLTAAEPFYSQLQDLVVTLNNMPLTPNTPRPIVAIIDSGANINHQAFTLTDALWKNPGETPNNGLDDDGNGLIDDYNGYNFRDKNAILTDSSGHGTHVAGIALGVGQNIFDLTVDINAFPERKSKIQLMVLKFIGANGGSTSDAINAILYAVNKGARVLNNSWGGPSYSKALEDAILFAYERDVLFIAAAGNSSSDNNITAVYPANYNLPNVISVAASNNNDNLTSFSNFGTTTVDLAAPGSFILSTSNNISNTSYQYLSGTSMAGPMVAGVAALSIYANRYDSPAAPVIKPHQIKEIILSQADEVSAVSGLLKRSVRLNPNFSVAEARITPASLSKPAVTNRTLASSSNSTTEETAAAGCGLVKIQGPPPPPSSGAIPLTVAALFMLPIALAFRYRMSA